LFDASAIFYAEVHAVVNSISNWQDVRARCGWEHKLLACGCWQSCRQHLRHHGLPGIKRPVPAICRDAQAGGLRPADHLPL